MWRTEAVAARGMGEGPAAGSQQLQGNREAPGIKKKPHDGRHPEEAKYIGFQAKFFSVLPGLKITGLTGLQLHVGFIWLYREGMIIV